MLCLVAVAARADDPPGGHSAQTFPEWWSTPGSAGWRPQASLAGGTPWTFAGLTAGAWQLYDPLAPAQRPSPGIAEAQAPLAWYDSAAVAIGQGAAWRGFGAGLVTARGILKPLDGGNPRAMFTSVTGTDGIDRNGVLLARGDASRSLRVGAIADQRGGFGALDVAGDHLWMISTARQFGAHAFDVSFAQRGMGESQAVGQAETGRGQSGSAGWTWQDYRDSVGVRWSRGFDLRTVELHAIEGAGNVLVSAQRQSSERTLEFAAERRQGPRAFSLRIADDAGHVSRLEDYGNGGVLTPTWDTHTTWVAARDVRPLGEGTLETALGAGHDGTFVSESDRNVVAPSLLWHVDESRQRVRLYFERVLDPVWSDLAAGGAPFLQHTWTGGFGVDAGTAPGARSSASLDLVAGHTRNRALAFRLPIRTSSLEVGTTADAHAYDFLLLQSSAKARWSGLAFDASGYALARGRSPSQPRVDPALGGRVGVGGGFRAFANDLGVRLRLEAAYVGARESDTGLTESEVLPGYGTLSASTTLTLGDATIVVRGEDLEGVRHTLTWIDYTTGALALDGGRTLRAEVSWPLFN